MACRRSRLFVLAVASFALATLTASAGDRTSGLPETLRVLAAADEMPEMFSFDSAGPPGLERELLEGFCRIHGLQIAAVPVHDFSQIIPRLLRGEGDVIVGIVDTPARRQQIAFTTEVFPTRHLAVTRRPRLALARPEDLRTLRVGVIPGTTWAEAVSLAGVPKGQQIRFGDATALLSALRARAVDATVMALLDFALAQKHDPDLVAGPFIGPAGSAALGLRRQDTALAAALNAYLAGVRQARHGLMFKYLSEDALSLIALARRQ